MAYKSAFSLFNTSKELVLSHQAAFLWIVFIPRFISDIADASNHHGFFITPYQSNGNPFYAIGGLLTILLLPAGLYLQLKVAQGKKIDAMTALRGSMKYFWRLLGLGLVTVLSIALGLVALIVPGIILLQRLFLAPYVMIDKDLSIREAMKQSFALTKNQAGPIWGIIGVFLLLSLFGIIPILGGLIASILLTLYACAPALRYEELKS